MDVLTAEFGVLAQTPPDSATTGTPRSLLVSLQQSRDRNPAPNSSVLSSNATGYINELKEIPMAYSADS